METKIYFKGEQL